MCATYCVYVTFTFIGCFKLLPWEHRSCAITRVIATQLSYKEAEAAVLYIFSSSSSACAVYVHIYVHYSK